MCGVLNRGAAGELILPEVLHQAEELRRQLGTQTLVSKGSIAIATLEGDVHSIGKALLVTLLSAAGYTVHDLGSQVPIERIVEAAEELQPDAIGLSALLVTTSRQMPLCIQELDRQGLRVPVLVGGAAINRAFGRRAAILPDGRAYEPGVFYCRDVFEGIATMDALTDATKRAAFVQQVRAEIDAERSESHVPAPASPSSRAHVREATVPKPPHWGARTISPSLRDVWRGLDRNTLFRFHWGGYQAKGAEYERIVRDVFEPELERLMDDAERDGWLEPRIAAGYFPCNADGDELIVFDPANVSRELTRLAFPRQPDGEQLCLTDYFRPINSRDRDVLALQAVTVGPRAAQYVEELQRAGEYRRMLFVNGLASSTAEALADYAHDLARRELGLQPDQGLRLSWGYAACPDLEEQRKVLPLLNAEEAIGLRLTLSSNLDPEHSTAAMVLHHPEAKYFSVRSSGPA